MPILFITDDAQPSVQPADIPYLREASRREQEHFKHLLDIEAEEIEVISSAAVITICEKLIAAGEENNAHG
ncbi:MAG: hypothetical protein WA584_23685 [Pyrinomonadaceae bacterium]